MFFHNKMHSLKGKPYPQTNKDNKQSQGMVQSFYLWKRRIKGVDFTPCVYLIWKQLEW